MDIDQLEPVDVGGSRQWIRIRARHSGNPLLLLVQMGPGLPMINEVRTFERTMSLEERFTVVYWDQRGWGLSARSGNAGREPSLATMVSDTEQLLMMLCERFETPAIVAGFSMGAAIAALAAGRRPDLVATLVAVGMDIDGAAAGRNAYEFALETARGRRHRKAIKQLDAIGPPPHVDAEAFGTRGRWAADFGGVRKGATYTSEVRRLLAGLVRSSDYSVAAAIGCLRGIRAARAALVRDLETLDLGQVLPRLDVPIVIVQGRHDQIAPAAVAEQYAQALHARSKRLVWFEHSAHMPHLEEPDRFREVLAEVPLGRRPAHDPGGAR